MFPDQFAARALRCWTASWDALIGTHVWRRDKSQATSEQSHANATHNGTLLHDVVCSSEVAELLSLLGPTRVNVHLDFAHLAPLRKAEGSLREIDGGEVGRSLRCWTASWVARS